MILTPSSNFYSATCRGRWRWLPWRCDFLAARNCPRLLSHVATVKWFSLRTVHCVSKMLTGCIDWYLQHLRISLPDRMTWASFKPSTTQILINSSKFSSSMEIVAHSTEIYWVTFRSMSTNTEPCKSGRNEDKLKRVSTWQRGQLLWNLHCSNEKWNTELASGY